MCGLQLSNILTFSTCAFQTVEKLLQYNSNGEKKIDKQQKAIAMKW